MIKDWSEEDFMYSGGLNTVNGHDDVLNLSPAIELVYDKSSGYYLFDIGISETSDYKDSFEDINIYTYDHDVCQKFFNNLSKEQSVVDEYESGFIRGHIYVESDRRVKLTTIPYDEGWSVYVNGKEVEPITMIDNTFIGLEFPDAGSY